MFQFLLGRLETSTLLIPLISSTEFQFLLGRLETFATLSFTPVAILFQFLLGRLETELKKDVREIKECFNSS